MSIVALIIAPLIKGKEAWETWYYGMIPIGIMLFGTYFVYYSYWRNVADITESSFGHSGDANVDSVKKSDEKSDAV
jgi:hypothetical protein